MTKDDLDLLTLVIAACALAATFWQGYLARLHNRLVVRPMLVWSRHRALEDGWIELTFAVVNVGVGPAVVCERYFTVNGERYVTPAKTDEVLSFAETVIGRKLPYRLRQHGLPAVGAAIPAGESQIIARLVLPGCRPETLDALEENLNVGFCVRYESLYGEPALLKA